jgi:hypothetical protein
VLEKQGERIGRGEKSGGRGGRSVDVGVGVGVGVGVDVDVGVGVGVGVLGWWGWMPHPSARRQWPQVDHGSIPRGLLALGPLWGGATSKTKYVTQ